MFQISNIHTCSTEALFLAPRIVQLSLTKQEPPLLLSISTDYRSLPIYMGTFVGIFYTFYTLITKRKK